MAKLISIINDDSLDIDASDMMSGLFEQGSIQDIAMLGIMADSDGKSFEIFTSFRVLGEECPETYSLRSHAHASVLGLVNNFIGWCEQHQRVSGNKIAVWRDLQALFARDATVGFVASLSDIFD